MPPFEKFLQGLMEDEAKWDEVSIMLITLGRSGCCACFGPPEPKGFFRMINMRSIRRAIAEAFPQLAIEHIRLDSSGWDNVVAVVNHEIVFRFPRRPEVARTLEIESRLLPELRKVVSLPIPHFEFISQGFVGYRLIPGEPLTKALLQQADSKEARRLAQQLAEFLSELHSFPLERAIELSVPHTPDRDLWASFYAEIRKHVFLPLLAVNERAWAQQLFESFLDNERNFQFKPVLLHGDFSPDHILFDRKTGRISGIIDFGDVRIGDPAYDFQLQENYGEQFWQALLAQYKQRLLLADARNKLKIDETFFRRLEFYAKRLPFSEILYGLTYNAPEHIASGLQALRRVINSEGL